MKRVTTSPWPLVVASGATALLLLDVTVVYLASPSIGAGIGASFSELQWVVDAYALAMAAVLLPAGALADRWGRKRTFLAGLALFGVGSVACAAAPDATTLDLARALQGLGAAGLFATSLALIGASYEGHGSRLRTRGLGRGQRRGPGCRPSRRRRRRRGPRLALDLLDQPSRCGRSGDPRVPARARVSQSSQRTAGSRRCRSAR